MRLHLGDLPTLPPEQLEQEGWTRITGPNSRTTKVLVWLFGIFLFLVLITPTIIWALPTEEDPGVSSEAARHASWFVVLLTVVLSIPAHELIHAAFFPDHGLSQSTIFALWPRKLRFGVFFDGVMSKSRWLLMRSAPFVILGVLPTAWLGFTGGSPRNFTIETSLSFLILMNSLGSGADLIAAHWVLSHIPNGSTLLFRGSRAYWKAKDA